MSDAVPRQTFFPAFRYDDPHAAIAWLKRVFGFAEHAVYTADDGAVLHAQLELDGAVIMLGEARPDDTQYPAHTPGALGGATGSTYVALDDVDGHYGRAVAEGARIISAIRDQDYGSREYSAFDCGGYIWTFGTYRP